MMKHATLKPKLLSSSMQLNVALPGALPKARNPKKQVKKVIHIPRVSISKQKDMAINRQSCQPVGTSCRDRSPTPHTRSKADTRESCQPTSTSYRARSPTPPPWDTAMPMSGPSHKVPPYHYIGTTIHSTLTQFNYTKAHNTALKINQ